MMAYLIDTDIIIYSLKGNETVNKNLLANKNIPKSISVITYGELVYGARKSKHVEKNVATVKRVSELFSVVELNKEIIEIFGEIKARLELSGTRLEDMDLMIGSTALYLNQVLVTNNEAHFSKIPDLKIENWTKP